MIGGPDGILAPLPPDSCSNLELKQDTGTVHCTVYIIQYRIQLHDSGYRPCTLYSIIADTDNVPFYSTGYSIQVRICE